MQRKNLGTAMRYLVVVCALISAFVMVGCGGGGEEGGPTVTSGETINSVNTGAVPVSNSSVQALVGQPFNFSDGSIFDPSIPKNQSTTLTFTSPSTSTLTSGGSTSTANTTFGSCTFAFTQGPLAGKTVKFDPCNIQITSGAVTAGGGAVSGSLTLTLVGPFGTGNTTITVQITILANGSLLVNGTSTGIIISSNGTPTTTGTTGTGGQ